MLNAALAVRGTEPLGKRAGDSLPLFLPPSLSVTFQSTHPPDPAGAWKQSSLGSGEHGMNAKERKTNEETAESFWLLGRQDLATSYWNH